MENTLDVFKAQQAQAIAVLNKLQAFLQQGEGFGIEVDRQLMDKLNTALNAAANQPLKIALIGGFSEGKTSIAAAWMEKLDKSSMHISHQESSNAVKVYDAGDDLVLIDTPGLFGFKEKYNEDSQQIEKYKEITKKYISEAHLLLYVMNSTNPIKESHREDLHWLFRTLNLLDRTVFVLSRFDEVADVEDEQDYQRNAEIKRGNVASRLQEMLALTPQEQARLSLVAVAANPFDMGTEYWLENPDKFRQLSHISLLQQATASKIKHSGGVQMLESETQKSIIRDVLTRQLPVVVNNAEKIALEVDKLQDMSGRLEKEMNVTRRKIGEAQSSLRTFVTSYFSDLIIQVQGLSMETFNEFFEREVGDKGVMINTRLQNEFDRHLRDVSYALKKMELGYESEINHYNSALTSLGKQGLNYVVKSKVINNTTILAARDGISAVAKTVGLDLGKWLKFKPWGAVNLAKGLNGALAFLGVALEAWDSWEQARREKLFAESLQEMQSNFNKQREELLDLINDPSFAQHAFPDYARMGQMVDDVTSNLQAARQRQQQFSAWRARAEAIDGEFTRISG